MSDRIIHYWTQAMHDMGFIPGTDFPVATDDFVLCCQEHAANELELDRDDPDSINFSFNPDEATCPRCRHLLDNFNEPWKWSADRRRDAVKKRFGEKKFGEDTDDE